jgi:hypothetical protein
MDERPAIAEEASRGAVVELFNQHLESAGNPERVRTMGVTVIALCS